MVHAQGVPNFMQDEVIQAIALELLLYLGRAARCFDRQLGKGASQTQHVTHTAVMIRGPKYGCRAIRLALNQFAGQCRSIQKGKLKHDIGAQQLARARVCKTGAIAAKGWIR